MNLPRSTEGLRLQQLEEAPVPVFLSTCSTTPKPVGKHQRTGSARSPKNRTQGKDVSQPALKDPAPPETDKLSTLTHGLPLSSRRAPPRLPRPEQLVPGAHPPGEGGGGRADPARLSPPAGPCRAAGVPNAPLRPEEGRGGSANPSAAQEHRTARGEGNETPAPRGNRRVPAVPCSRRPLPGSARSGPAAPPAARTSPRPAPAWWRPWPAPSRCRRQLPSKPTVSVSPRPPGCFPRLPDPTAPVGRAPMSGHAPEPAPPRPWPRPLAPVAGPPRLATPTARPHSPAEAAPPGAALRVLGRAGAVRW